MIDLNALKNVDIRTVDKETLVEAETVTVDMELPVLDRMMETARKLGNPYCFKCGGIAVKIEHADTTVSVNDRLESYLRSC